MRQLPSLCSPQTFIGVIILLYVYLTLENSISLHQKILVHQKKTKSVDDDVTPDITHQPIMHLPPASPLPPPSLPPPPPPPPPPPSITYLKSASTGNFYDDFNITWGDERGKILDDGDSLRLSLDRFSGSGFQSKKEYLFAKIEIQMKLVANNSAGTVTTYYLSSDGTHHDEIDFEFLGNVTGEPYTLHTNVYCQGVGNREQQFYLWFDPTEDFHTYSILWNPRRIVFLVDGTPIREFKNMEKIGVPFPKDQPMRIYSSLWNADDWATQGGRVKTDWSNAPFVASYRRFTAKACVWLFESSTCDSNSEYYNDSGDKEWMSEDLNPKARAKIRWLQNKYMTYDYCKDVFRFPQGLPKECGATKP